MRPLLGVPIVLIMGYKKALPVLLKPRSRNIIAISGFTIWISLGMVKHGISMVHHILLNDTSILAKMSGHMNMIIGEAVT
jgi:hypothetical protein